MPFCERCGFEHNISDKFCNKCGSGLSIDQHPKNKRILSLGMLPTAGIVFLAFFILISLFNSIAGNTTGHPKAIGAVEDFFKAVNSKDIEKIRQAIKDGVSVNVRDGDGYTALMLTVRLHPYNMQEIAELLIAEGADVNARQIPRSSKAHTFKETVLISAISSGQEGQEGIIKLLLSKGARINERDSFGRTALMWAAYWGREEIIRLLLSEGADSKIRDKDGKTALMHGRKMGYWNPEMIQLLEDAGAGQ